MLAVAIATCASDGPSSDAPAPTTEPTTTSPAVAVVVTTAEDAPAGTVTGTGSDTTDGAPIPAGSTPATASAGESEPETTDGGCVARQVLDEYGFPVEVETCQPDGADLDVTPAEIVRRIPDDEVRRALDATLEATGRLAADCGDVDAWSAQLGGIVDGTSAAIAVVERAAGVGGDMAAWIGGDDAYRIADLVQSNLVFPTGCGDGVESPGDDAARRDRALATAGRLSGIDDDLRFVLTGARPIVFGSDFWFHTDEIGHLVELADPSVAVRADTIDTLLLGPSTVKRGIDPVRLSESTGSATYNAAVGALATDLQVSWYRTLVDAGVRPASVVVGVNTWIEFTECASPQQDRVEQTDTNRARAFAEIPLLAELPPGIRLSGGATAGYDGRALAEHRGVWVPDTGGFVEISDEFDEDVAATQRDLLGSLPYDEECTPRFDRLASLLEQIVGNGAQAVLVALPTSDEVASLHPDGRAGHDAVVDRYAEIAAATGATLLDLTDLVDDAGYVDLTHVDDVGRDAITDAVAEVLDGAQGPPGS